MARTKAATLADIEALADKCETFGLDLHDMCDRLDQSFGDKPLRDGLSAPAAQRVNAVALAAALLNSKILAIIAHRDDLADIERKLTARLTPAEDAP